MTEAVCPASLHLRLFQWPESKTSAQLSVSLSTNSLSSITVNYAVTAGRRQAAASITA